MSFRYTNVQYTEMVRTLAQCGDNVALACRTFNDRHGTSVDRRTMLGATQRLRDFGTFRPNTAIDRGRNVQASTRLQDEILDYFSENPQQSTREAAPRFNVSHMYVWRTYCNLVYCDESTSAEDLKDRIVAAFETVKRDILVLSELRQQLRKRAFKCIEQGGGHFESVLKTGRRRMSAD